MRAPSRPRPFAPSAIIALTGAVLALAGCGGGSSEGETETPPDQGTTSSGDETTASTDAGTPPPDAEPEPLDPSRPPPQAAPPPDSPEMAQARERFTQGMQAYQANDFGRAASLLSQVDDALPSPELAYNIAYCYQRMADTERAIRYFRRYLDTGSPTEAERADVGARIAQMEALAVRQRDMTMTLPPTMDAMTADAAELFASGQEMFRRRRYPAALQAFSAAAAAFQAVGVEVPELVFNLAVTSERLSSLDDAADYYDEYLRQRPTDPEADRIRAHIAELRGRRR